MQFCNKAMFWRRGKKITFHFKLLSSNDLPVETNLAFYSAQTVLPAAPCERSSHL